MSKPKTLVERIAQMNKGRARNRGHFARRARHFTPKDWCWFVAGDETKAYYSKTGKFIKVDSDEFLAWEGAHGRVTRINSMKELKKVLKQHSVTVRAW